MYCGPARNARRTVALRLLLSRFDRAERQQKRTQLQYLSTGIPGPYTADRNPRSFRVARHKRRTEAVLRDGQRQNKCLLVSSVWRGTNFTVSLSAVNAHFDRRTLWEQCLSLGVGPRRRSLARLLETAQTRAASMWLAPVGMAECRNLYRVANITCAAMVIANVKRVDALCYSSLCRALFRDFHLPHPNADDRLNERVGPSSFIVHRTDSIHHHQNCGRTSISFECRSRARYI